MEPKQKLVLVEIEPGTVAILENYLNQGYIITQMVSLQPTYEKLLIIYGIPPVPEPPE